MTTYVEHKRIESYDGLKAVTLEQGDHGLWRFVTWKFSDPAPDIPEVGGPCWMLDDFSGFYQSLADAQAAVYNELGWISARSD